MKATARVDGRAVLVGRGRVGVLLDQELRREITRLRAKHGSGLAALGLTAGDDQGVRSRVELRQRAEDA